MKYATDEDRDLQDAIDQWRTGSTEAFHDIESWRDDAEERDDHRGDPQRQWPEPPENLYGRTLYLIGQLTARYRHLDTGAIMATYEAVDAWHTDHRDTRLPNQVALEAILDRATMTLQAVETDICGRRVREEDDQPEEVPAAVEHPADGPAPGTTSDDYVGAKGLREGGHGQCDHNSAKRLKTFLRKNKPRVHTWHTKNNRLMIHLQQYRDAANKSAPPVTHEDVKTIAQGAVDAALQKDRAKRATVDSGQLLPESIATLELHPDICRTLLAAGIPTLENLAEKTDAQLRAIDGLSARDVNEIRVKVAMGSIE